jgi:branched-chain amino acid transport system ATP-binding protein
MSALLEVEELSVRYGNSVAVRGVSFEVAAGELLAVAGANGAGKSTTVNAVAGWSRGRVTVEGTIRLQGRDLGQLSAHKRAGQGVALVPESRGAFGSLTVAENLTLARAGRGGTRAYTVDEIYDVFPQLRDRRSQQAGTLSGGERQMVSIGRALRAAPALLILDEPSVGLAPRLVVEILEHVKALTADGLGVLLVEQNVRAALEVADRLSLLDQGRIVATGTAAEMRDDPRTVSAYLGELNT